MNTIKLGTAIAAAALVMGVVSPAAFAATNVTVSGNGALSSTKVKVKNTSSTNVTQGNSSKVTNIVGSSASTGKNSSSWNTGGTSAVATGNATSNVTVGVGGSSNTANLTSGCGCASDTTVNVSGNGALSHNKVYVKNGSWLNVLQANVTEVLNVVGSKSKTGGNDSDFNTGGVSIVETGDAASNVTVNVTGSTNTLNQ